MAKDHDAILAYRWSISGSVQGVGFRWFVLNAAKRLGVTGWVRNTRDGGVEVMGQGTVSMVHDLEKEISKGPRLSIVENLKTVDVTSEVSTFKSFEIN